MPTFEATREPHGTARQRLLRMGFAGAVPGGRKTLGADTRLLLGAFAGIALAGAIGLGRNIADLDNALVTHDAPVYEGALFQRLVIERRHGGRLHAASRKLAVSRELLPGEDLRIHWCWSGLGRDQAPEPCRALLTDPEDPRRINPVRLGDSALLRAGSLAEPIRACAEGWPDLSVAVIAGDPWSWPEDPQNNQAARQLAIQLLDSGAVDMALIGPAESEQPRALARRWAFVENSQWLFFSRSPEKKPGIPVPAVGRHRALIHADYAKLALHLRDRVDGVLDPGDQHERLPPDVARIEPVVDGNPRIWGGPDVVPGTAGIERVRVCPGTFTMGSPSSKPKNTAEHLQPSSDELPAHAVILDGFEIARTETTWRQLGVLHPAAVRNDADQAGNQPAADINWKDAKAACQRWTADGDLPTEAQWEYAARGGAQTPYPFPSELTTLCDYANGAGNETLWDWKNTACSDPYEKTAPVGRFPPNPLGLHDMHGNVWEWVRDCYDGDVYSGRGRHPTVPPTADSSVCERVLRGGSFLDEPRNLRSADRDRFEPGYRYDHIGFRCVRGSGRQLGH